MGCLCMGNKCFNVDQLIFSSTNYAHAVTTQLYIESNDMTTNTFTQINKDHWQYNDTLSLYVISLLLYKNENCTNVIVLLGINV